MKTIQINLYPFAELSEEAKEKTLDNHRFMLVDCTWWEGVYEDARQVGLKITGFELENGYYCNAEFMEDAIFCAGKIQENHGQKTDTYQSAISFWDAKNALIAKWPKDQNNELCLTGDLDAELETIDADFLTALKWAYHSMLIKDYNFLTGDQAITETFEANDYHFTTDGKLATRLQKLIQTTTQI